MSHLALMQTFTFLPSPNIKLSMFALPITWSKKERVKLLLNEAILRQYYFGLIQCSVQFFFAWCVLRRNTLTCSNGMTVTWTGPCVSSSSGQASVSSSTVEPGRGVTWPSSSSSSSCSVGVSDDRVILSTCKVVRFCCVTFPLGKTANKNTGLEQLNDTICSWRYWKTNSYKYRMESGQ